MKKLFIIISMFVAISVNAQDDMYMTKKKAKVNLSEVNERLKSLLNSVGDSLDVRIYGVSGVRMAYDGNYHGVVLFAYYKDGHPYVLHKQTIKDGKDWEEGLNSLYDKIKEKYKTD